MLHSPTGEQLKIINNDDKFIQVHAGPGTGKTYTLLRKIEALIREGKLLPLEKVLFCTYTNALTSSNLQSLVKDGNIDPSKVKVSTLDGFLVDVLCKLSISESEKSVLHDFDGPGYIKALELSNKLLREKEEETLCLLQFMVKRYPYIFIDEIQDIKDKDGNSQSSKFQFLCMIRDSSSLKQLVIVGDNKQSIYNQRPGINAFSLNCTPLKLTLSKRKDDHSGDTHDLIMEQVVNSLDTEEKTILDALKALSETHLENETMVVLQDLRNFAHKEYLEKFPAFWYGANGAGQYTMPQTFINSLYWYKDLKDGVVRQSLESVLLPYKSVLNRHITFPYFKCRYFQQLNTPGQTFSGILKPLLEESLQKRHLKVTQLKTFFDSHLHLHTRRIDSFKMKFVITTIDSSKGLEADNVYLFLNGRSRSLQHDFVSFTRHKKKFYVCSD